MTNKYYNYDDSALIIVFIISYLVSMYIQVHDPDIKVTKPDWVIGFLCSMVGGYVAYTFFTHVTDNPGEVMFYTILSSVVSPKAFKLLVNPKIQERIIRAILDGLVNTFSKNRSSNDRDI
jgi:hypothetical protein